MGAFFDDSRKPMIPAKQGLQPAKFAFIDSLRGWAILLVILTHAGEGLLAIRALTSNSPTSPMLALPFPVRGIADAAGHGVQLFFVVSAFSLTLSWLTREKAGRVSLSDYWVRRFFRIAPMFYLGILFYTLVFGWGPRLMAPHGITTVDVILTLIFLHVWHDNAVNSVVPGGWSIGVEMMSYILLPLALRTTKSIRALLWAGAGLVVFVYAGNVLLTEHGVAFDHFFFTFPAQAPVFLIGISAGIFVSQKKESLARLASVHGRWIHILNLILFMLMVAATQRNLPWHHILFSLLAALLCIGLYVIPNRFLVNKILSRIGVVSFSIYLIHFALLSPCFEMAQRLAGPQSAGVPFLFVYYTLIAGISFALASVTYQFIEVPGMALGKQVLALLRVERADGIRRAA